MLIYGTYHLVRHKQKINRMKQEIEGIEGDGE